jgi:AbiU2
MPHSREVVNRFCELCDWLLQSWQTRKYLFDENPDLALLQEPRYAHFFYRIGEITQEYWLHQLAKMHDPARDKSGNVNLSISYIVECGEWDKETKPRLDELRTKMLSLSYQIKDARNKILSHNDLEIIMGEKHIGAFDPGDDEDYFAYLQEFASLVKEIVMGEPFVYDDLVSNDVEVFMQCFKRGKI